MAGEISLLRRWPYSAAATFVGLAWIGYGWSIWVAGGIGKRAGGGMWFGSLSNLGYYVAGSLNTPAVIHDGEWERLVSAIFLHGGFLHIIMNSAAILQLGRILEMFTTRGRCWFTLLFSGLVASLITLAWAELSGKPSESIGASGAACGLGGALIVLSKGVGALAEFRKQMITWIVVMLAFGLAPMISFTGHAGGALGGAAAGWIIRRRGSMVVRNDRFGRRMDLATAALTILFVAALAMNAWRAMERKAAFEEVDGMAAEVYSWLDGETPPDLSEWIARAEERPLPLMARYERDWIVMVVRAMQEKHEDGRVSPENAPEYREDLAAIQRWRGQ